MDGYALRADDCDGAAPGAPVSLDVLSDLPAGSVSTDEVRPGTAIRIMTGAPLPAGADSVVPVEATTSEGSRVRITAPVKRGANVRLAGEDLREGEELLPKGFVLNPAALGVLASVGLSEVPVHPRARVAILTTGDELVAAGDEPGPGQIRDSNIHTMCGQAAAFGAVPVPDPASPRHPRGGDRRPRRGRATPPTSSSRTAGSPSATTTSSRRSSSSSARGRSSGRSRRSRAGRSATGSSTASPSSESRGTPSPPWSAWRST